MIGILFLFRLSPVTAAAIEGRGRAKLGTEHVTKRTGDQHSNAERVRVYDQGCIPTDVPWLRLTSLAGKRTIHPTA